MSKKGKHSKEEKGKLKVDSKVLKIGLSIFVVIVIGIIIFKHSMQNKEEINEKAEEQKKV